jgi:hypothetical protein
MLDCWNFKSDLRPSFSVIHDKLIYIYEKYETELANETLNINLNTPSLNFTNSIGQSKDFHLTMKPTMDLNKQILLKRFNNNILSSEKRLTRQSESEDSQYFSGTDMSNSLLYVDSSNFSSASSHYSAYAVPTTSIMATSLNKRPPSPPPPQPLTTLLNVASKVYEL